MIERKKPERDWKEYNEHLVQGGEILLAVESLQGWQEELREMNLGKNGRPFKYPRSLMLFLGTLRVVFSLPYRQLEGFARRLGKLISIPAPDYSTLSLRLPTLDLPPVHEPKEGEEVVIAVDGTGIKVTNRGEWMGKKRLFGEVGQAVRFERIVKEIEWRAKLKVWVYNLMLGLSASPALSAVEG